MSVGKFLFIIKQMLVNHHNKNYSLMKSHSEFDNFSGIFSYGQPMVILITIVYFLTFFFTFPILTIFLSMMVWGVMSLISALFVGIVFHCCELIEYTKRIGKDYNP